MLDIIFNWTDKKNDEDFVMAEDINAIAGAVKTLIKTIVGGNIMKFCGVVDALPETANEGDVYKVSSGLKWTEYATGVRCVTVGCTMSNDTFDIYIYGDSGTEETSEEIIKAVEACGTTPAPIKIVQYGNEYIINVESYERYINTDVMPPMVGCTFYGVTNVESYTELAHFDESDTIDIYYGAAESKTYVYHNGAWEEI